MPWHSYASKIHLPMLGRQVPPLDQENPTCRVSATAAQFLRGQFQGLVGMSRTAVHVPPHLSPPSERIWLEVGQDQFCLRAWPSSEAGQAPSCPITEYLPVLLEGALAPLPSWSLPVPKQLLSATSPPKALLPLEAPSSLRGCLTCSHLRRVLS